MTSIVNGVYKPMVYKPTALNSLREKKKHGVQSENPASSSTFNTKNG